MKIKKEVEVNIKTIHVSAGVRYWEDSIVNGLQDDEEGSLMPCIKDGCWVLEINPDNGQILNWKQGTFADVHYKVCDQCSYSFLDDNGEVIDAVVDEYVPGWLSPKENGYGDYIIMDIDENGFIQKWKFNA